MIYLNLVIKVEELKPGVHGYNIFVKVLKVENESIDRANGEKLDIATCVVGDETACVRARITGPNS